MNVFLIHHRSRHHANNSGYGRLIDYSSAKVVYGTTKFPYRIAKFLAGFYSKSAGNYNSGSVLKAIELYQLLKKHKNEKNIVHFLNGERDIRHLDFFKRKFPNTKFVATFHKPPKVLKETITDVSALRKLDGAIAVGANQVDFLKDWLQLGKVVYIPHGVDTGFFKPNKTLKEKYTLLFVGQHLRDFDTFNSSIPKLAKQIEGLKVNVILHPRFASRITPHPNVKIFTKVSDSQLLEFYQQASALYLPMLDSTACNSLLEAMACGLSIITSKVGGNMSYLEGTVNVLVKNGNGESFINKTIAILQDENRLLEMGRLSRERSLELDWSKTAKIIESFYLNLGLSIV